MTTTQKKKCSLCDSTVRLEEHHEIPRAYGGHDSQLHWLCVSCHDFIHDLAVAVMGKARRNITDYMLDSWAKEQLERVPKEERPKRIALAKHLVKQIVTAATVNRDLDEMLLDNPQSVQIEMPRWLRAVVKRAAHDRHMSVNDFINWALRKTVLEVAGFTDPRTSETNVVKKNKGFEIQ